MATTIRATCPIHGDVLLSREQVRLVLHPIRDRSFYTFTCSLCEDEVRKPVGAEVKRLLLEAGVVPEKADFPLEAAEEHVGAPLNRADLLDFAIWLENASTIAAAAAVGLYDKRD